MHTPDAAQQILSDMANPNFKNINFWCVDEGVLPPMTPINPYLGEMHEKNGPLFNCQSIYAHFGITSLELNMAPGVLLEPYMSQGGGQSVTETPIVLKGLKSLDLGSSACWKKIVHTVKRNSDTQQETPICTIITCVTIITTHESR